MNTALCWKRFTRFPAERKTWWGLIAWKTTMMAINPKRTGSIPLSPLLMRRIWAAHVLPERLGDDLGGNEGGGAALGRRQVEVRQWLGFRRRRYC